MHQICISIPVAVVGSHELYTKARATLIARGSNLNRWCKEHGINRQTVDKALKGISNSQQANSIRGMILKDLLLEGPTP